MLKNTSKLCNFGTKLLPVMDKFAFYVALLTRSRAQRLPVVAETVAQLLRRRHTHRTCKRPGLASPPPPPEINVGRRCVGARCDAATAPTKLPNIDFGGRGGEILKQQRDAAEMLTLLHNFASRRISLSGYAALASQKCSFSIKIKSRSSRL